MSVVIKKIVNFATNTIRSPGFAIMYEALRTQLPDKCWQMGNFTLMRAGMRRLTMIIIQIIHLNNL